MSLHKQQDAPLRRINGGIPLGASALRWTRTDIGADLSDGEMIRVEIDGSSLGLYCVDRRLYATDNVCTHAYALLTDGWLEEGLVECPLHGGRFDVTTGKAQGHPVTCDLRIFPVRVVDGIVEIGLPTR